MGRRVSNIDDAGLRYSTRVLIRHPSADLSLLSELTGIKPNLLWKLGEPRGVGLRGKHERAAWSYWFYVDNRRDFSNSVDSMISALQPARNFLQEVISTGGDAQLIVHLEGERNIGDTLSPSILSGLADLGLGFGIEVFPKINR